MAFVQTLGSDPACLVTRRTEAVGTETTSSTSREAVRASGLCVRPFHFAASVTVNTEVLSSTAG